MMSVALLTAALPLIAPVGASAAQPTGASIVLRGSSSASVELTFNSPWTLPEPFQESQDGTIGAPYQATYSGRYAGFMLEQAPQLPGDFAKVKFGLLFIASKTLADPSGSDRVVPFGYNFRDPSQAPNTLELAAGRYRFTLLADGPARISIPAGGVTPAIYEPTDPVASSAAAAEVLPVAGDPAGLRMARLRGMAGGYETVAIHATLTVFGGGLHNAQACFVPTDTATVLSCPDSDCSYKTSTRTPITAVGDQSAFLWQVRYPGVTYAGWRPPSFPDNPVYAPTGDCPFDERSYDALYTESVETPATTGTFTLFVRPAAMKSSVEGTLGMTARPAPLP